MKNETGGPISKKTTHGTQVIEEYIFGDISSTIYPVGGGLEDWAYGAGWDYENNQATLLQCQPQTYVLSGIHQSKADYETVRSAIYIIETDSRKKPEEQQLGSRLIAKDTSSKQTLIQRESIDGQNTQYDGHINRNIRASLALIDLSKPYIHITNYKENSDATVEITW